MKTITERAIELRKIHDMDQPRFDVELLAMAIQEELDKIWQNLVRMQIEIDRLKGENP
jgi:hypothetical protein